MSGKESRMRIWQWTLLALACMPAIGCRTDPRIAALEQELRLYEDRIYELQDRVEQANDALESCRRENQGQHDAAGEGVLQPPLPPPVSDVPSATQPVKPPEIDELPDLQIETPSAENFQPEVPDTLRAPAVPPPPGNVPSPDGPGGLDGEAPRFLPDADQGASIDRSTIDPATSQVHSITLDELLTGGFDLDGRPGDEGLSVLVRPRDPQGRLVKIAAPISIVVIDPALPGEAARVARWDFSAKDVADAFAASGSAEGFHLELRWPAGAPRNEDLRLFVRYMTADGRQLHADRPIEVAVKTPMSAGGTASWRRKEAGSAANSSDGASSQLQAPTPPGQPRPSVAQNPNRPSWSPDRR